MGNKIQFKSFSASLTASLTVLLAALAAFAAGDRAELTALSSKEPSPTVVADIEKLIAGTYADDPFAYFYYARNLERLGNFQKAKQAYEKALKLDENSWVTQYSKNALVALQSQYDTVGSASKNAAKGYLGILLKGHAIREILPNSPAALRRLQSGDVIVSVNNNSVKDDSASQVLQMLAGPIGSAVDLVIERAGNQYSCHLVRTFALMSDELTYPIFEAKSDSTDSNGSTSNLRSPNQKEVSSIIGAEAKSRSATGDNPVSSPLDKAMVAEFRQTSDTPAAEKQVMDALACIPESVKLEFRSWGLSIMVTPTVLDARPEFATEKPRGYDTGGGFDNCAGLFLVGDKTVLVAEKVAFNSQPYRSSRRVISVTLHECGHAYDYMKSNLSTSESFLAAYNEDCGHLTNETRRSVRYFTQAESAGPQELLAELFVFAANPNGRDVHGVTTTFPRTFEFMKKQMKVKP